MNIRPLKLSLLPGRFAVCQLKSDASIPQWALQGGFFSLTRTADEFSVVCQEALVPADMRCERSWRLFKVHGPFDLSEVGVLASLAVPLAQTGISLFTISTFETDYLLVPSDNVETAIAALVKSGHGVSRSQSK